MQPAAIEVTRNARNEKRDAMNTRSKHQTLVRKAALLAVLLVAVVVPAAASAEVTCTTISTTQPFTRLLTAPCLGEPVLLEGTVHVVLHTTVDANGGTLTTRHTQPMGVTGVGLVSGTTYHATGVTERVTNAGPPPSEFTIVNNFNIIGEGDAPNFLVHQLVHVTINANVDLTAEVDQDEVECR
jgi:hypothetical protein